jgi:hypothetical protein
MSRSMQMKAALVGLLIAAQWIGRTYNSLPRTELGISFVLLLIGIVNVLFSTPGTYWVRVTAVGVTFATLLFPGRLLGLTVLLAWLVWPAAFMVAWAVARPSNTDLGVAPQENRGAATKARIALAALIAAVAVASVAYQLLVAGGLQQTAGLFIGIPALLAIVTVFAVSPRSATGVACKAVTVGMLVSMLFLGEGILCVVMSAPIFYAVAIAIASSMDWAHRRREKSAPTLFSCLIVLALVPMTLEGVTDFTTLSREESVTESKIVRGSSHAVQRALFEPPRFDRVRPLFLRAGFPSPVSTRIDRSAGAVRWVIQLRGGEMRLNGMEPRTGDLILELEATRPGLVRWRAVSDSSHMTHFLLWREVMVQFEPVDEHTTKVTWTLRYRRGLDPSWYFGPMERYAVRLAARYLIDSVATP